MFRQSLCSVLSLLDEQVRVRVQKAGGDSTPAKAYEINPVSG